VKNTSSLEYFPLISGLGSVSNQDSKK